jgi:hypothetical protein
VTTIGTTSFPDGRRRRSDVVLARRAPARPGAATAAERTRSSMLVPVGRVRAAIAVGAGERSDV